MSKRGIDLPYVRTGSLPLACAAAAIAAASQYAERQGLQVSIAVVDAGGHLLSFARVAGTPWHSISLAVDKACTSISFALPSHVLGNMIDNSVERIRMSLLLRSDIVAMGGAFPLSVGEQLVGAIGVSGASEQEDMDCALAGCEAINAFFDQAQPASGERQ